MAPPHRDFDARPRTATTTGGSFVLAGRTWHIRSRNEIPYELLRQLIGVGNSALVAPDGDDIAAMDVAEQRAVAQRAMVQTDDFFAATIVADEAADFLALAHDPLGPFSVEMSQDLTKYIAECIFNEEGPTAPSKPSPAGRRQTGSTSKGASSSRVTPKKRSAD